jgi:hypothetical protein
MMSSKGKKNRVDAFIDWENIRHRLSDNYIEKISISQVMDAVKKVANEIGVLRLATFYGDFISRRDDARTIQGKPNFAFRDVLRARSGSDQTDPALITDLISAIYTPRDFDIFLLCAGDAHYCEPIRQVSIKHIKIYICAVGVDVSPDLTSLAPFYPIEKYLDITLTPKKGQPTLMSLSPRDMLKWAKFVSVLDSMESKLPWVAVSYFHKDIMLSYNLGGQTQDARSTFIENARVNEIISIEEIDNPTRPGYKMRIIKLNRENAIVKEILARK